MQRNHKIAIIGGVVASVVIVALLANKGILGNKAKTSIAKVPLLSEIKAPMSAQTIVKGSNNTTPNDTPNEQVVKPQSPSFLLTKNNTDIVAITGDASSLGNVTTVLPDLTGGFGAPLIKIN